MSSSVSNSVKAGLVILIISAVLIPIGLEFYNSANTDLMTSTQLTIWNAIPTMIFVVILLGVIGLIAYKRRGELCLIYKTRIRVVLIKVE